MSEIEGHHPSTSARDFRDPAQDQAVLEQFGIALDPGIRFASVDV
jgi:hypothetical protein